MDILCDKILNVVVEKNVKIIMFVGGVVVNLFLRS